MKKLFIAIISAIICLSMLSSCGGQNPYDEQYEAIMSDYNSQNYIEAIDGYNANNGSGAPSVTKGYGSTKLSTSKPTRSGYDFLGWSTSNSAPSASYSSGGSINLTSDITLYSVKIVDGNGNVQTDSNGNEFENDGGKITCNAGFFKKLIAFFKALFGLLPEIEVKP